MQPGCQDTAVHENPDRHAYRHRLLCCFVCKGMSVCPIYADLKICGEEARVQYTLADECDVGAYLWKNKISQPVSDRETVSVAANILHLEENRGTARLMATRMMAGVYMSVPLFWTTSLQDTHALREKE